MISQALKPSRSKNKGFSIIELLVATVIIGLLAAVAITSYLKYKNHADMTAIHTTVLSIPKDFNNCMTESLEQDSNYCCASVRNILEGTKIKKIPFNCIASVHHTFFLAVVENDHFNRVCIHLNAEGQLASLSYKGVSADKKVCYKNEIPHLPIKICDIDADCSAGSTCNYKTGVRSTSPPKCA